MASKPGSIVHVELHSADPAKSKSFYGEVFGWKFEEIPEMNYTMWKAPNEPAGGLMKTMEGRPPQVLNYILSESVETTLRDLAQQLVVLARGVHAILQHRRDTDDAIEDLRRRVVLLEAERTPRS